MKQNYIPRALLALGVLATGTLGTLTACVDNSADSIRIIGNVEPGAKCALGGTTFLSSGIIDIIARQGYLFTPSIENRTVADLATDRLLFLESAVVKLRFEDGFYDAGSIKRLSTDGLSEFTQPLSGSIPAGVTSDVAFEVISKPLLEDMASKLAKGESTRIIVDVKMRGAIDGSGVSSPVFSYPITVCNDCLTVNIGQCAGLDMSFTGSVGGSCNSLQDGNPECCVDADGGLVCPAVAPPQTP